MGVVCALDITHDPLHGFDSYLFADYLRQKRDQRIKYIISNSRICYGPRSPSHGGDESSLWKWSPYNGENPHTEHCHISVGDSKFYDLSSPWDLTGFGFPAGPPTTAVTDKSLLKIGSTGEDVRLVQERIMVDGIYGSLTEEAVRRYQLEKGLSVDGKVGPETWASLGFGAPAPSPEPAGDWIPAVISTVFGGRGDFNRSAYDNSILDDTSLYASLPWRLSPVRSVDLRAGSKILTNVPIKDVGPWMTDDNYHSSDTRPLAESCFLHRTPLPRGPNRGKIPNGAGIDISPAAARALGISGKGKLDWRFHVG